MATTSPARFAALTDAAIELIAELGMRGLTHRAVDARAGLPAGTASAYLRTRKALVEAVVQRIADLDTADLAARAVPTGAVEAAPDLDALAASIAALLDDWLTTGRTRTLARYACLLEATHHPELRPILAYGVAMRAQAQALLTAAEAPDAEQRGSHLVAAVDGLLFDRLAGAGSLAAPAPGTPRSRADLTMAVRNLLRAVVTVS
ncbi:TetR/AcrR family transcriptional regulator [Actinoplanes sp. NPDC004185]